MAAWLMAQAAKYAPTYDVYRLMPIRSLHGDDDGSWRRLAANGELDAEYIVADSEHSQLSIAQRRFLQWRLRVFTGSSGAGRASTATELYSPGISGSRMPVSLDDDCRPHPRSPGRLRLRSTPTRCQRVTWVGWMGWSCDAQEAFDNHIIAYRILAEDPQGAAAARWFARGTASSFRTSCATSIFPDQGQVNEYLPPYKHPYPLEPAPSRVARSADHA